MSKLSENATVEARFRDASYYFWILAVEFLSHVKNAIVLFLYYNYYCNNNNRDQMEMMTIIYENGRNLTVFQIFTMLTPLFMNLLNRLFKNHQECHII